MKKKKLKEKVTIVEKRAGRGEGKCRDLGLGAGRKMEDIIYAAHRNLCSLAQSVRCVLAILFLSKEHFSGFKIKKQLKIKSDGGR